MEDISESKKKTCIFANLSIALLSIALLLFTYALINFENDIYWIVEGLIFLGVGIALLAFPMGLFSLIRIYRNKTTLVGKKRAWTTVIIGFVIVMEYVFNWYGGVLAMWIFSFISVGILAAIAIVVLAVFLCRRFGPATSLLALIIALVVLGFIALAVAMWINDGIGNMMAC